MRIAKSNKKYINIQKSFWTHFGNEHAFNIMRVSVWIYVVARHGLILGVSDLFRSQSLSVSNSTSDAAFQAPLTTSTALIVAWTPSTSRKHCLEIIKSVLPRCHHIYEFLFWSSSPGLCSHYYNSGRCHLTSTTYFWSKRMLEKKQSLAEAISAVILFGQLAARRHDRAALRDMGLKSVMFHSQSFGV